MAMVYHEMRSSTRTLGIYLQVRLNRQQHTNALLCEGAQAEEHAANQEIAQFLNDSHLSIRKDQDEDLIRVKVDKQMVGDIFADPFYFGLYRYGKNFTDLVELYNFLPLITPDEYVRLNQEIASDFHTKYAGKASHNKRLQYGLLRGKVICDYCDSVMVFQHQPIQRGKNKGKWLISFYCRNTNCQRHRTKENKANGIRLEKSIRGKYVMAAIEWTLRNCTKKSKAAYRLHIEKLRLKLAQNTAIAKRKLSEAKNDLEINEQQYVRYQQFQLDHPVDYKKHHNGKLEHHEQLMKVANHNIVKCKSELEELKKGLPTEEEFYELIDSYLLALLNAKDLVEQDAICNELVLNLRAGDNSISVVTLNKPYDLLVDLERISIGRGERI